MRTSTSQKEKVGFQFIENKVNMEDEKQKLAVYKSRRVEEIQNQRLQKQLNHQIFQFKSNKMKVASDIDIKKKNGQFKHRRTITKKRFYNL